MASVEKRVRATKDGRSRTTWLVRWRDDTGRQRKKSFDRKVDAERWRAQVASDLARGAYVDMSNPVTVAEYARRYVATRGHRPATSRRVESYIKNHVEGVPLGAMRLVAVKPSDVQGWASERSKHLKPSTLRNVLGLVRAVFAAAVLDRVIASTPVVKLTLAPVAKAKVVPLTVHQVQALAEAMDGPLQALVIAQAGLGLRIGEVLALRVGEVDFLRRTVRVEEQLDARTRERAPLKTPASVRTVPLPKVVADALARHIQEYPTHDDGLIFHDGTGKAIYRRAYGFDGFRLAVAAVNERARVEAAAQKSGTLGREPLAPVPADTTSHDLRHHYASVLLAAGESVVAVAERLGHENATLVLTTYGHLMPDSEDRTRKAVESAWEVLGRTSRAPHAPETFETGS